MTPTQLGSVLVVGAGIMGAGIAQVAAQAGHMVWLFDLRDGAALEAKEKMSNSLLALVNKGKFTADEVAHLLACIHPIADLAQAAQARWAVEAIVEALPAKQALLHQLEALLAADAVLASNTSSISITAMACGMAHPERVVGMHFFNPVPQMKLVEVVSGLQTSPAVAQATFDLAQRWGKVPVHARSTPGFIVNRIARPYYAEALALLQEQATESAALDACLRGAGFRMGPCELMDLIGHDTNFAVTRSVFEANFYDKRFVPSLVQRELVDGGLLGRKSGRGFFDYSAAAPATGSPVEPSGGTEFTAWPVASALRVAGVGAVADRLAHTLQAAEQTFERNTAASWVGLEVDGQQLRLSDGRCATQMGADVAVFDLPVKPELGTTLAWAASACASTHWQTQVPLWLAALGWRPQRVADTPALLVMRTLAMLINEAADAVQQGVCTPAGADTAMKLGVNYPAGPFEWLAGWNVQAVVGVLNALDAHYRGERYRVSPWLQQQAWSQP